MMAIVTKEIPFIAGLVVCRGLPIAATASEIAKNYDAVQQYKCLDERLKDLKPRSYKIYPLSFPYGIRFPLMHPIMLHVRRDLYLQKAKLIVIDNALRLLCGAKDALAADQIESLSKRWGAIYSLEHRKCLDNDIDYWVRLAEHQKNRSNWHSSKIKNGLVRKKKALKLIGVEARSPQTKPPVRKSLSSRSRLAQLQDIYLQAWRSGFDPKSSGKLSMPAVASDMNARGYLTPRGKPWTGANLRKRLREWRQLRSAAMSTATSSSPPAPDGP